MTPTPTPTHIQSDRQTYTQKYRYIYAQEKTEKASSLFDVSLSWEEV